MSRNDEVRRLAAEAELKGRTLTAEMLVEAAKSKRKYPKLHEHLWAVSEAELAMEARIQRAHSIIVQIRFTTEEGATTRTLVHTKGTKGYQPVQAVAANANLAALKLQQLAEDIGRAKDRLRNFKSILPFDVADEIEDLLERAQNRAQQAVTQPQQAA